MYNSDFLTFGYNPIQYGHKNDYKSVIFADFYFKFGPVLAEADL